MNLVEKILPFQKKGSKTGATARWKSGSEHAAEVIYNAARLKLFEINRWFEFSGNKGAHFQLTDSTGKPLSTGLPVVGNLIRIKLPAPPNKKGDGFDWVRIEKIESEKNTGTDEELHGFTVRPVKNPQAGSGESAHFYKSDATSTFLVYRKAFTVYVMERGRNETPNLSGSFFNKLRNAIVAIPAMLGFSKPQWKMLVEGILDMPA